VKIEVTAEDIANGDCDSNACPVALAMLRAGFKGASVEEYEIHMVGTYLVSGKVRVS